VRHRETITLNVALHEREGLRRELLDGLAQIVSYMPIRLDILENPPALCGDVNRLVRAHARSTGKVLGGMEHCPTCNPATPEDSRNRQWRQKRSLLMLPRTLHLGDRDAVLDLLLLPRQQRAHRALSPTIPPQLCRCGREADRAGRPASRWEKVRGITRPSSSTRIVVAPLRSRWRR